MCLGGSKQPSIPPPLPMPPAPKAPPPPRTTMRAPEVVGNPNDNIGIVSPKSKRDRAGTVASGTNQLKIPMNLGSRTTNSGINIG